MATQAQLEQDLINAVATVRVKNDRAPMDFKFSNGKTYTVYSDGSGNAEDAGINFRDLTDKFNAAESTMRNAAKPAATPIAQVAPQASTPAPNNPPPVQPTTPVAQVAPQAAAVPFALQGGNAAFFPNLDPKTGLPIIKQSVIDAELNRTKQNVLTANNSNIRDAIYGSGWNAKSDAVNVLHGAAVYGLNKATSGMGGSAWQSPAGKALTDADFVNAAKEAGIDPNQYMTSSTNMGMTTTSVNRDALYNAINDKAKNLYSITNVINSTGPRGASEPHATILFTSDGNGNLVAAANPTTGQPAIQYESATRYANDPGFLSDWGPLLGMAGLAFGIPALSEFMGPGVIGADIAGGTATAGLEAGQVAASNAIPDIVSQAGMGGGLTAGYTGNALNAAGTAAGLGGAGYAGLDTLAGIGAANAAGLPLNQVQAYNPSSVVGSANTIGTTGDVIGSGAGAMGTGALAGAGGTAAGNALTQALSNNGLLSALGAGAGALSSYLGGQAQADAAKQAAANQMSMFNTINNQLAPQRGAGYQSLNQIRSMLPGQYMAYSENGTPAGVQTGTDYLTRQFSPQDLYAGLAPNYNFMLEQGQNLNQRQANVGGGALSGNTLQGLENYTQNYAQNAYQSAFNNFNTQRTGIYNTLAGIAGLGQQAVNTGAQAGQNATTAAGQLGVGAAAANAAGLTGAANAAQGGLQNYQQNQILQAILGQNQNVAQTATPPYAP